MADFKKMIALAFKGFCMGVADVIPGVSGGTVAFLTGIYEELIQSIASFDTQFLREIGKGRLKTAFSKTGWKFLAVLLTGILTAIFSLSHLLKWLMEDYPVYVYAFFFGLILTTVFVIAQKIQKGDFAKLSIGMVSAFVMFRLAGMIPMETPETWWFLFFSGAVAICAMILPGISGAYILLLLGKYHYVITAVSERNAGVLIIVAMGCAVGLLCFTRILRLVLTRYHDLSLSVLAGLVLGSLRKVWPWKEILPESVIAKDGHAVLQEINVFPDAFTAEVVIAALLFILGICVSLWLAAFDQKQKR